MRQNRSETIARLTLALAQDYRLMPLYLPDLPVFLAVALPLAEGVTGLKPRLPAGRGVSAQQSLISAGAEALELRASLASSHLPSLQRADRIDGMAQVGMTDLTTGETVRMPAQSVFLDSALVLGEPLLVDADSTGCAAGATVDSAILAALCECVERDALALWWHGGRDAGQLATWLLDPLQPRLSWWLDQRSRQTCLLDLTTDLDLPVVAAVSADPDGRRIAIGTAARPRLAEAALAAITEMVQTEVSLAEARHARLPEALDWDRTADLATQPQFRPDPRRRPPRDLPADALLPGLARSGLRPLLYETTLPGDPLPTVRVVVPGLNAMRGRIATDRFRRLCPGFSRPRHPEPF